MDIVQIAVLVVIALLLLVLVRRLAALAGIREDLERLDVRDELRAIEALPESFARLESLLESLRPPPAVETPEPPPPPPLLVKVEVADDVEAAVRSALEDLHRDLKKMLRLAGRSRAEKVGARISQRLRDQGFTNVRITGGLPRTRSRRSRVRVPVDAERDGLPHRGVIVLRGDEVMETRLSPLHRMFP